MKSLTTFTASTILFSLATACSTVADNQVTFYGWPDNDPASAQTAYDCGGRNNVAGGTGTYTDPLTFATAPGEYNQCEILYLPLLKKYIRMEDSCAQCTSDFSSGKRHIDIWTGSNTSGGGQTQIQCEDDLTTGGQYTVVRQPPTGLEVDSTALFADGQCNKQAVYESNQATCDGSAASSGNLTEPASGDDGSSPTASASGSTPTGLDGDDNGITPTGSAGDDDGSSAVSAASDDNGSYPTRSAGDGSGSTPTTFMTKTSTTSTRKHKDHKSHKTYDANSASSTCTTDE